MIEVRTITSKGELSQFESYSQARISESRQKFKLCWFLASVNFPKKKSWQENFKLKKVIYVKTDFFPINVGFQFFSLFGLLSHFSRLGGF